MGTLRTVWITFKHYRRYLLILAILGFFGAFFEGVGINATVPLLSFLLGAQTGPTDTISRLIEHAFTFLHIPFTLRYLIILIFALFLFRAFAITLFGYIRGWISADFYAVESRAMVAAVLRSSWPYLLKQKMGTLQNVLVRDIQQTTSLLDVTSQIIQSFSGFLIYLLVAVNIAPTTTVAVLVGGAILILVVRPFLQWIQNIGSQMVDTEKLIGKFISEQILGMKSLKAAGIEQEVLSFGDTLIASLRQLQMRISFTRSLSGSLFQPFTVAFIAVVFLVSYKSPGFNAVGFIATLYLIQKMFTYLESGQSSLNSFSQLIPYARSVAQHKVMLGAHREEREVGEHTFVFNKELSFNHVALSYIEGEPAVQDISLTLKRGHMLALIGPSGAGKTTIADLALRLFEPSSGYLTLDGVAAKDISLSNWRRHIGYVSQDVFLFNGTIEENIRLYRHDLTHQDIVEATKQANIYDFIMALPEAFNTIVGDRGVMLSGGQRQRIALARALAGKPDVLVLDEATSALDTESEQAIQVAIRNLHGRVAVLVIAHRLSTVEHADTIVVVERGRITEMGSPKDLKADPSSYFAKYTA